MTLAYGIAGEAVRSRTSFTGVSVTVEAISALNHTGSLSSVQLRSIITERTSRHAIASDTSFNPTVEVTTLAVRGKQETVRTLETSRRGGTEQTVGNRTDRNTNITLDLVTINTPRTGTCRRTRGTVSDATVGNTGSSSSIELIETDACIASSASGTGSAVTDLANIRTAVVKTTSIILLSKVASIACRAIIGRTAAYAICVTTLQTASSPSQVHIIR